MQDVGGEDAECVTRNRDGMGLGGDCTVLISLCSSRAMLVLRGPAFLFHSQTVP